MTYPTLAACSSGPEARICIFLVPFERKHFEGCGNVKEMLENNTLDLVKDNTKKKQHSFLFFVVPSSLKFKRKAIMYYSSPDVISILATRWQQSMCNLLD
jgi:hypothetical protein